ncbi:ArsA family ATPase [Heliobacterium chlorum]|uniref:ArsA family ATPase n=1 Tax=Heliobacterium chlorum TaxID=2698 RepID=A0ABR7T2R5_HELCL|nr:ArsA family ATPase [Heliobacterium chlorum]MBC9784313.1 ArsA family ATPase [Heliobacterium chlorum]
MNPINTLLLPNEQSKRLIFFSGKGGVGKTSMACLTALHVAKQGFRTLLMTTDPAAHIGNILEQTVTDSVTEIPGIDNLFAVKIDPKSAAEAYKQQILSEASQKFSENTVLGMKEELDSPCTEEMASFQKFIEIAGRDDFEVIVIDTAPTGHTLRLLELPMDWSKQIQLKVDGIGELSEEDQREKGKFDHMISLMKDPSITTFAFVMYPEKTPIVEAFRASQELESFGIRTQLVVANLVIPEEQAVTPFFKKRREMQMSYIEQIRSKFTEATLLQVPLFDQELKRLDFLNDVAEAIFSLQ